MTTTTREDASAAAAGAMDRVPAGRISVGVPVRYFQDRDAGTWCYAIANPAILSGPYRDRDEAEGAAAQALVRSLRHHGAVEGEGTTGMLLVTVEASNAFHDASSPAVADIPRRPPAGPDTARVADVMSRTVVTVAPDTARADVIAALRRFAVGGVPVVDADHRPLGLVSEADLLATASANATDQCSRADSLMTRPPLTIAPTATVREAVSRLRAHNVRRLMVTGEDGRLVGIVSRRDLLQQ